MINANVINGRVYSTSNTIQEKDMQIALLALQKRIQRQVFQRHSPTRTHALQNPVENIVHVLAVLHGCLNLRLNKNKIYTILPICFLFLMKIKMTLLIIRNIIIYFGMA